MDQTSLTKIQSEKLDRNYKKKRVEEIGSTLAQIRARHKANRSACPKKDDETQGVISKISQEKSNEKNELSMLLEEDRAKAEKLEKERPKIKEALENLKIDREQQKMVEKKIEETRAKQAAPLPEIPPEIQKRIFEMEMTIHNLRETIGEKDKVLSSKTESLKMLNDQLSQRSSEYMERAEAMRHEIDSLKEEHARQEDLVKTELARTKNLLEQTEFRLSEKEAECNNIANIMEELNMLRSAHSECERQIKETKHSLEIENKLIIKLKAQIKSLRTERDNLKKEHSNSENLEELQNKIALLEEEKGNLQLQLVDFDESKELALSSQKKVVQLEEALHDATTALNNLQEEKKSMIQQIENANLTISNQESFIKDLQEALTEMKQNKIAAEMKAVELEEKLEAENNEENLLRADKLEKELDNLRECLAQQENIIHSLNDRILAKEKEMKAKQEGNVSIDQVCNEMNNWKSKCIEAESKIQTIHLHNEKLMKDLEEMKLENVNLLQNSEELKEQLENRTQKNEELSSLLAQNNENVMILENEISKLKGIEQGLRNQIQVTHDNQSQPEKSGQTQKIKKLAANFKIKAKLCHDLEAEVGELNKKLIEKDSCMNVINEEKDKLESTLSEIEKSVDNLQKECNQKDMKIQQLEIEIAEFKNSLNNLEAESYTKLLRQFYEEIYDLISFENSEYKMLESLSWEDLKHELSELKHQWNKSVIILKEKETVIQELDKERRSLSEKLNSTENELVRIQTMFEGESIRNEEVLNNIKLMESTCCKYREEIDHLLEQLTDVTLKHDQCEMHLQERTKDMETLEQDRESLKLQVQNIILSFEENKKIMEERSKQLEARLNEAEVANEKFDKYQMDMEKQFSVFQDNEKMLNTRLNELKTQLEELKLVNSNLIEKNNEFEQMKESSKSKISELETELESLKNIKDAYNCTLDQIEILNEDLKQVMAQIESRNQELIAIDEERRILVEKLTDMEDSCSDLHCQVKESESHAESLKSELEMKGKLLDQSNQEILNLQAQLSTSQAIESQNIAREMEISSIRAFYEERIQTLQQEKDEIIALLKVQVASEVNDVMNMAEEKLSQLEVAPQQHSEKELEVFKWDAASSSISHRDVCFEEAKDEEDGWGWIAPESKTEGEQKGLDSAKIQELLQKIHELEEEKSRMSEDLRNSQIKCGKLAKKAKEVIARNEALEKAKTERKGIGFEDLDFALQEEMRSQIDKTEQKNKEISTELNLLKTEKERLLKRIDTLTSANEQLIEMKERQDIEVQMWQKRSNELKNQIQGLEWNIEELRATESIVTDSETEEKLTALVLENEELQRIICELKDNRTLEKFDKGKIGEYKEPIMNESTTSKQEDNNSLPSLSEELKFIREQCDGLLQKNEDLNNKIVELNQIRNNLQDSLNCALNQVSLLKEQNSTLIEGTKEFEVLECKKSDLDNKLKVLVTDNQKLMEELESLRSYHETVTKAMEDLEKDNISLKSTLELAEFNNITLKSDLESEKMDNTELKLALEYAEKSNSALELLTESENDLKLSIEKLTSENQTLKKQLEVRLKPEINQIESSMSYSDVTCVNPPVFRGFSNLDNDPFAEVCIQKSEKTSDLKESSQLMKRNDDSIQLKNEIYNLKTQIEELTKVLEAERTSFNARENVLFTELQKTEQEVTFLQGENLKAAAKFEDLKKELSILNAEKKSIFLEKQEIALKLQTSLENVHLLQEETKALRDQAKSVEERLTKKTEELNNMEHNLRQNYCLEIRNLEDSHQQALLNKDEENAHLICELSSKEQLYSSAMNEVENLKKENMRLIQDLQKINADLEKTSEENNALKSYIGSLNQENDSLKSNQSIEANNLIAQIDYLNQSISEKENLNEHLTKRSEQREIEIQSLQKDLSNASNSLQFLEVTCSNLKANLAEKDGEIITLKKSEETLKEEKFNLEIEISNIRNMIEANKKESELDAAHLESEQSASSGQKQKSEEIEMLVTMLAEKDLEIERISKILNDTQERLIQIEEARISDEMSNLQGRLDEALYTLHLRDVRCEELTLEIMQLLEERDTLQLRLSEALRLNERLRSLETPQQLLSSPISDLNDFEIRVGENDTSLNTSSLNEKIGELHTGYRRDPAVQQERESRHSQQMQLYTQRNASREELNSSSDYGIFNWFFSSSSPTPASPRPTKTT